jgi:pimeloyl-ACP methyl ester carboxylesterase
MSQIARSRNRLYAGSDNGFSVVRTVTTEQRGLALTVQAMDARASRDRPSTGWRRRSRSSPTPPAHPSSTSRSRALRSAEACPWTWCCRPATMGTSGGRSSSSSTAGEATRIPSRSTSSSAALAGLGARAPIVTFPYGGDHSYWHNRADGAWATYVVEEVIPRVAHQYDGEEDRVAVGGISMGGLGAFDLALHFPDRFCAVGGHAPALWQTGADTAAGRLRRRGGLRAQRRHRDGGVKPGAVHEPAGVAGRRCRGPVPAGRPGLRRRAASRRGPGHDQAGSAGRSRGDYWNSHWGEYLRFYAQALAHCNR